MSIEKWRNDTPNCESMIHFNNAGSSLPVQAVNQAIIGYLEEEQSVGGYELEAKRRSELDEFYSEVATLIHAKPSEIAITDSASTSFSKAIFSIPFIEGDEIITSELEYVNNFLAYLKLKKDKGIKIKVISGNGEDPIFLDQLEEAINSNTKLIAITHMPTSSGVVAPIEKIGEIAAKHEILYLVDTCQSVGQYPLDVRKIKCDFLTATARKYLRGPRGLGFLYVNEKVLDRLEPPSLESGGARWQDEASYKLNSTIKMFENYEKSYALVLGFKESVKYINRVGIEVIWQRIQELSQYFRDQLLTIDGVQLYDGNAVRSGIIAATKAGLTPQTILKDLTDNKVNAWVSKSDYSVLEMGRNNLEATLRLSLHYYNTQEEIDKVVDLIRTIK